MLFLSIHENPRPPVSGVLPFYAFYGEQGKDYIEVHHLRPVHSLGGDTVDPRTDMAVLCSNCHRMIHRKRDKVLSIEELKNFIATSQKE